MNIRNNKIDNRISFCLNKYLLNSSEGFGRNYLSLCQYLYVAYYSPLANRKLEIKEKGNDSSQIKWKINSGDKNKSLFSGFPYSVIAICHFYHYYSIVFSIIISFQHYYSIITGLFSLNETDLYSIKEFVGLNEQCCITYRHSNTLTDFKTHLVDSYKNTMFI